MERSLKRTVSSESIGEESSNASASNSILQSSSDSPMADIVDLNDLPWEKMNEYQVLLNASVVVGRFLLNSALPFQGRDESENSFYKGLFLPTLDFIGEFNETIRNAVSQNVAGNNQIASPSFQKDIATCFVDAVMKSILEEIGDDVFALLVDEYTDAFKHKQLLVVLRYVDPCGVVKERFVGIGRVMEISTSDFKSAIDSLFDKYGLSLKQVRGQCYDRTHDMHEEFSGLKALILRDNRSAYYIHWFAQELQLVVVAVVAKNDYGAWRFFDMLDMVMNVVLASCEREDVVQESYRDKVQEAIGKREIEAGRWLDEEFYFLRGEYADWGSHHKTILTLIALFPEVVKTLEYVEEEGRYPFSKSQAYKVQVYFDTFDFVFYLHLMGHILGVTRLLSQALQRKDQDILETVSLIEGTKRQLQAFRENGFDPLLEKIYSFCEAHDLEKLDMTKAYVDARKPKQMTNITYRHYYEHDIFNAIVDMEIQEFGDRFSEVSIELLKNMAALSPRNSFSQFNTSSLLKLSELYPYDFNQMERLTLVHELSLYYDVMHRDERFANLNGIADLATLMVKTGRHISFPSVYRLLKLVLVLPVATASVERCFSKIKRVMADWCNQGHDDFLNASIICATEREALAKVTNGDIINRFQKTNSRMEEL